MLVSSEALVLHRIRYNEKSNIACLYTRDYGRISYLVPAATGRATGRSKSGQIARLISPPAFVQIVAEHKPNRELQYIREASFLDPLQSLRVDPIKSSIAFFIGELLYRILPEPQPDQVLYAFLVDSFSILDTEQRLSGNFHLCFLWYLLIHLGFSPDCVRPSLANKGPLWFDINESAYTHTPPTRGIPPIEAGFLPTFSRITFDNYHAFRFSRGERRQILDYLLSFYRSHLPHFGELRSLSVLAELFG